MSTQHARWVALATACFSLIASDVMARPAAAIQAVNVRAGPGTSHNVVDVLYEGEQVDITECEGRWCRIEHSGPDGWVSLSFLTEDPTALTGAVEQDGDETETDPVESALTFNLGTGPRPEAARPTICFYTGSAFSGSKACVDAGSSDNQLTGYWDDRIASIEVSPGHSVTICKNWYFQGACLTIDENVESLDPDMDEQISSYRSE